MAAKGQENSALSSVMHPHSLRDPCFGGSPRCKPWQTGDFKWHRFQFDREREIQRWLEINRGICGVSELMREYHSDEMNAACWFHPSVIIPRDAEDYGRLSEGEGNGLKYGSRVPLCSEPAQRSQQHGTFLQVPFPLTSLERIWSWSKVIQQKINQTVFLV